jgi:hypothetical protein
MRTPLRKPVLEPSGYMKFTGPLQVVHMICLQMTNYAGVLT